MATPLTAHAKGLPFAQWPSDEQDQFLAGVCAYRPELAPTRHLHTNLRDANIARDLEWDTSDNGLDGSFFGNELAGEVGEAIEAALEYLDSTLGAGLSTTKLADELADVVICIDLLAIKFDIDFCEDIDVSGDFVTDLNAELLHLAMYVGRACNTTKKLERERLGLAGSRTTTLELFGDLHMALVTVQRLARAFAISLDDAVARKFNKTSDKVGLKTKLFVASPLRSVQ